MTLSNIFFGKKVVQQAYLNNALIYQSKGWQTLPSTFTEVWTKELGSVDSNNFDQYKIQVAIDSDNNIYVLLRDTYVLLKLSSEGDLIWSQKISGIRGLTIDPNNDIYIAMVIYDTQYLCHFLYIAKLDSSGNIESKVKLTNNSFYYCDNFVLYDNYFYITGYDKDMNNNIINNFFYKYDKNGKEVAENRFELNPSTLIADDSYLYAGQSGSILRFDKNDITKYSTIKNYSDQNIRSIRQDGLGNIYYFISNGQLVKLNLENKTFKTILTVNNVYLNNSICFDFKKNVYVVRNFIDYSIDSQTNLVKFSSDDTLIYDSKMINASYTVHPFFNGKLCADNNGNIYYIYPDPDGFLQLKKIINIEKKGS